MSNGTLANVRATTAAEICRQFQLGEDARQLLRDGTTPVDFLDRLRERQLCQDAARFLAHALPKREAVWWACLCARSAMDADTPKEIESALGAAENWVREPSEENRRAALPAAEAAQFGTPAGCAAVAAFWSGGSLGPPNVPLIPPGEYLTAHAVTGAVMLAVVVTEPEKASEKYQKFLAQGIEVAEGTSRWKETTLAAR